MAPLNPEKALAEIIAPSKRGDGWRNGWLGDSGMGKTTANAFLIEYALTHGGADLVLTLDDKSNHYAQYQGCFRGNPGDLHKNPPGINENQRHIVFRGVALTRRFNEGCSAEDLAELGQGIVGASKGLVLINIDELADATNGGQAWKRDEGESKIAQVFRKGRGVGLSITWTTQVPQSLPREAFALSDTIGSFRLSGREVEYIESKRVITPELAAVIPSLQVGQFIVYNKARGEWDGNIYQFRL
jgi:hypothetical protein